MRRRFHAWSASRVLAFIVIPLCFLLVTIGAVAIGRLYTATAIELRRSTDQIEQQNRNAAADRERIASEQLERTAAVDGLLGRIAENNKKELSSQLSAQERASQARDRQLLDEIRKVLDKKLPSGPSGPQGPQGPPGQTITINQPDGTTREVPCRGALLGLLGC